MNQGMQNEEINQLEKRKKYIYIIYIKNNI